MTSIILTVEHEFCVSGPHCILNAAGGAPVIDALDAATSRLEVVVQALADLMFVGEVSQAATLAYFAAESALALVYASQAGIESALAPQNAIPANRGAHEPEGPSATLAERSILARKAASLSQEQLAKLIGVKQSAVAQIESGMTKRSSYLPEIAVACGVNINWLAFGPEVAQ